jgi:hypothetical protein
MVYEQASFSFFPRYFHSPKGPILLAGNKLGKFEIAPFLRHGVSPPLDPLAAKLGQTL